MRLINVAAASLNVTPLDWDGNMRIILDTIQDARGKNVQLLCLPELCISGYGCEDMFFSFGVLQKSQAVLKEIIPHTKGIGIAVGLPMQCDGSIFNVIALVVDGKLAGFTAKRNLANDGLHYEQRWFKAWPVGVKKEIEFDGAVYPIGDLFYKIGTIKIGFEICEDAWVADRPGVALAKQGIDVILNPSASHFAFGKDKVRKRFVQEGSRAFNTIYLYANLLGNESGRAIYDGSTFIASKGDLVALGEPFSFKDYCLTTAAVDIDLNRLHRVQTSNPEPVIANSSECCIQFDSDIFKADVKDMQNPAVPVDENINTKEQEFAKAVTLALFDYLRKSHSKGYIVSLSGGADSSSVACLVTLMVKSACRKLGLESFLRKINLDTGTAEVTEDTVVSRLLCCVYQSTKNSSETTCTAARELARELGASFYHFDVERIRDSYTDLIETALQRTLTWEEDDIALQNIQARVRAPGIWMLANIKNLLLLSTSNRSEAAVGYATMDGDTCGGLSPIAGIDKAFLRKWLVWLEKEGSEDFPRVPVLSLVNSQSPTAELRPQQSKQSDEKDLMPYEVLDFIERAAIRDKQMPEEIFYLLQKKYEDETDKVVYGWIEKFFTLWSRNQWKRERYAPSFHLDDENLDPKTWCRFPILSGGFSNELRELKIRVLGNKK